MQFVHRNRARSFFISLNSSVLLQYSSTDVFRLVLKFLERPNTIGVGDLHNGRTLSAYVVEKTNTILIFPYGNHGNEKRSLYLYGFQWPRAYVLYLERLNKFEHFSFIEHFKKFEYFSFIEHFEKFEHF